MRIASLSLAVALLSIHASTLVLAQDEKTAEDFFQDAIKASQEGNVDAVITNLEKAFELKPAHPQYGSVLINVLMSSAMANPEQPNYDKFLKAEGILRKLTKTEGVDAAAVEELKPTVFYNAACAYANQDQKEKAKNLVMEAIKAGYKDQEQLLNDQDLASLKSDEFVAMVNDLFAKQKQAMIKQLTEGDGLFDFDFAITTVDGEEIQKDDYLGKVLIVDIWGTWCPPCRAEIPFFVEFHNKYKDRGFEIVGLNYNESGSEEEQVETIKAFMKEFKMPYDCGLGDREMLGTVPNFRGFPTTLFIDRDGKVRKMEVGFAATMLPEMQMVIETLLDQEATDKNPN